MREEEKGKFLDKVKIGEKREGKKMGFSVRNAINAIHIAKVHIASIYGLRAP